VETIIPKKTVGTGIKQTPAYDTPKTKAELEAWRKEFWGKYLGQLLLLSICFRDKNHWK
jgi:hypothetical protein